MTASIWDPLGGPEIFGFAQRAQREIVQYAAAQRDIAVEPLDTALYWLRRDGKRVLFYHHMPDSTTLVAREISNSKHLTKTMLGIAGVRTPPGDVFRRGDRADAWAYARTLGLPVVVKPLSGSGGENVTPQVADPAHFRLAWDAAKHSASIIVEKHVEGRDYRILVVGENAVCAAVREPAFVTGDGCSSVGALIEAQGAARAENRYAGRKPLTLTAMMERNLASLGLAVTSVLSAGRKLRLHEIANVGAGGESADVTDVMHPDFAAIAVRACRSIPGAFHAGVDLLVPDISQPASLQTYAVCEVNTRPDIALHHFPFHGPARDAAGALLEGLFPGAGIVPRDRWVAASLKLTGKVTGVGLRKQLQAKASLAAITGWVRNDGVGAVSAYLCGPPVALERIVAELAARRGAQADIRPAADEGLNAFEIRR